MIINCLLFFTSLAQCKLVPIQVLRLYFIGLLFLPVSGRTATYPISMVNGLLVSEATVEGKQVEVIFDSGAPGLVLNSKYYTPSFGDVSSPCVGLNGSFECRTYQVKNWSWMDVNYRQTEAILSDLSFIENSLHREIHALVGLSVLSDYYVSVDFDQMTVTLSKKMELDKKEAIHFQYVDQLPVITCEVNGEKKILGLDTGSEINYLFSLSPDEKKTMLAHASPLMVIGTENKKDLKYSLMMELNMDDQDYFSTFIIDQEGDEKFHHTAFDGFLGLEFLDHFNIIIHPGKQIILLTPRVKDDVENFATALVGE